MAPDVIIRGDRVRLRPFRVEDAEDVLSYTSDPMVTCAAGWPPHRSLLDSMAYIQGCAAQSWPPITFAVEYEAEQRVIGTFDIRLSGRLRRSGEIGYTLNREYWGQGLNIEAGKLLLAYGFQYLSLWRIQAVCAMPNRRSARTLEKMGMVREHATFGARDFRGHTQGRFVYSLLRREWQRRAIPTPYELLPPRDED